MTSIPLNALFQKIQFIRDHVPRSGLIKDKEWKISPYSFYLEERYVEILNRLGFYLQKFYLAADLLYKWSVKGKYPAFIAELLDKGKPADLIKISRSEELKNSLPVVIRPDLILTDEGFALCELDSVPGGIGLTAWLQETYGQWNHSLIGGSDGMKRGFNSIFPEGVVVVSEEAMTYWPEFEYLVGKDRMRHAESFQFDSEPVYRFFECFDWEKLSEIRRSYSPAKHWITPPLKPYLEEKLLLGLFWVRSLADFWKRYLTEKGMRFLQQIIPYTWIVDPSPLPYNAVLPGLEVQSWKEVGSFSQSQRELVLKVSGFSPLAWGSRGVYIGSDMPASQWQEKIAAALADFPHHPWIMQKFIRGKLVKHPYAQGEKIEEMEGRARVSPYYFVIDSKVHLCGVLVTICPSDKKIIHGMKDAIIVPASFGREVEQHHEEHNEVLKVG
ncbi:hypothetical protein A7K73_07420 [Candidatus Methylacidiphilum fumarolicum]|uniref:Glutathionylspermidine synthase n=2 Tax=Candidatus Methylacidiphilum fumarolicum TaxID=591154 RepID=I0JWI8_METFB|nr:hypothetical protein [Candidatus Methylacidiphilum fumarolicum]CCG91607.1 conserved hypothetical protein [Methylacidiphilum fumariolicum SolV]MBW6415343.1 hypothetical protein [Candidatus Methylacidiphilum fumarolicum]TFE68672.1 hypothetical protein A7K73_07420 [Candidatus Methylacidiphilum fumarolicum]TFE77507.1 hypothetical protein A7D33_04445 [Candidatus Methylacidiphilum fumarolicum]CAI9085600.1 conserved protein of unknown function [Candidatus Methylacidiphilum fumarolicum]